MTCRWCKKDAPVKLISPDGICPPCAQAQNENYIPNPYTITYHCTGYVMVCKNGQVMLETWSYSEAQMFLEEKTREWALRNARKEAA